MVATGSWVIGEDRRHRGLAHDHPRRSSPSSSSPPRSRSCSRSSREPQARREREPRADRGVRLRRSSRGVRRAEGRAAQASTRSRPDRRGARRIGMRQAARGRDPARADRGRVLQRRRPPLPRLPRPADDRAPDRRRSGSSPCSAALPLGSFLLAIVGAIVGWVGPKLVVARRVRQRLQQIDDGLPELIDLLVVTLEAGVALHRRRSGWRPSGIDGPLGEEIRLTIQEQSLGLSTLEALENWLRRCDTPSVRSFVRAMIQGDRLGVSIGQILRNQAVEMRARQQAGVRGARAEGADQDPLPARLPDLPGDVRDRARPGALQDHRVAAVARAQPSRPRRRPRTSGSRRGPAGRRTAPPRCGSRRRACGRCSSGGT